MTAEQWLNDLEEKALNLRVKPTAHVARDYTEAANPAAVLRLVAMVRALGMVNHGDLCVHCTSDQCAYEDDCTQQARISAAYQQTEPRP